MTETGPGPAANVRAMIEAQLAVELNNRGYRRCEGDAPNRVFWRWQSPSRVSVEAFTLAGVRSRTIEREESAMPLALPIFTGELLRATLLPESEVEEPTPVVAATQVERNGREWLTLLAQAEGFLSANGSLWGGGSLGARWTFGPGWIELGAGAVGSPRRETASGSVRSWGLIGRAGGGVTLLDATAVSLHLAAHAVALGLKVDGLSSGTAQGVSSWTPGLALRTGPQLRLKLGRAGFFLSSGVGGWLSGISVFDGQTEVAGVRGVEWWVQLGGSVGWHEEVAEE